MSLLSKGDPSHMYLVDTEQAESEEFNYIVDVHDLLLDLKALMKEYYCATFADNGNSLKIRFSNGQTFMITASETYRDLVDGTDRLLTAKKGIS